MRLVFAVLGLLSVTACKGLADGAKEEFSKAYTCPPDRVEVRERKDIDIGKFEYPDSVTEAPPAEVAADPGRLAMWNKEHTGADERQRDYQRSYHHLFEVRGCGHTVLYNCTRPGGGSSPGEYYMCSKRDRKYAAGTPAW